VSGIVIAARFASRLERRSHPQVTSELAALRDAAENAARVALGSAATKRPYTLEDQLGHLTRLVEQSRRLVEQVSAELEARAATAARLQQEAKDAEALAAINKEQADAIKRVMDADLVASREAFETEMAKRLQQNSVEIRKNVRRDTIWIALGSFIAGGGLTLVITVLVR
jgi:hypothetical protein